MDKYHKFCHRYGLDPDLASSRNQYEEAGDALKALYKASATVQAEEAIRKARRQ